MKVNSHGINKLVTYIRSLEMETLAVTNTGLNRRITVLEAKVAALEALHTGGRVNRWWDKIAGTFSSPEAAAALGKAARYGREWRKSFVDLERTPELVRVKKEYRAVLGRLKKLGKFSSLGMAAEYAMREFMREEASREGRKTFRGILAKVPARKPLKGDALPRRK